MSDEQNLNLLKQIAAGDTDACQQFVVDHYQWLTVIVRQQFPYTDLYMDIVHDAFGLTIEKLKANEINKLESIKFYLRTAAINIGYSYLRKDKKFRSSLDQDLLFILEDKTADVAREVEWDDSIEYVKRLIKELKVARDREILKAFYLEDKDKLSICQELQITPDHFSRVLFRAKHRLKELLMGKKENKADNVVSIFSNKLSFVGFSVTLVGMMIGVMK
ncbi:RNA polymerase sigma factor [Marinicella rhabdoformis]|uniref:RNA polymerase sigma factor n=1 Tax=Marinicella rhabdoformis TaxID=2580566 RepID=UPI0012AEB8AC|nr:sigma-70 family RNA polymerase sigma factor [Marinicella rhabdoformis]